MTAQLIILAIFCGVWYWVSNSGFFYSFYAALSTPLFISVWIGVILGDIPTAVVLGANINMMYLGLVSTGNNMPADPSLAALIAIPVALQSNMDVATAVTLAVPFAVLGVFIDQIRRTVNAVWIHMADRYAAEGNAKKVTWCLFVPTTLFNFCLRFFPVFLATLFGSKYISAFLEILPAWITHGLSVAGGILPAMGFAITIMVIGKKELMPFFFIGFFLVQFLGLGTMACAIFGACIAMLCIKKGATEV